MAGSYDLLILSRAVTGSGDFVAVLEFKARFPEFAAVSNTLIQLVLEEAIPMAGTSWLERDRKPAIMYYTAHLLALQGEPQRTAAGAGGAGQSALTGAMKRRTVGDVTVEFAGSGSASGAGMGPIDAALSLTPYGRQYIAIRNRNFVGLLAV